MYASCHLSFLLVCFGSFYGSFGLLENVGNVGTLQSQVAALQQKVATLESDVQSLKQKNKLFEILGRTDNKVIVVSPLNVIMRDQLLKLQERSIAAVQLDQNCCVVQGSEKDVINAVSNSSIILSHPESLITANKSVEILRCLEGKVGVVVVDECHKIDDWGKEFRKSFLELGSLRSFFPNCTVVCLSGTLTDKHIKTISSSMLMEGYKLVSANPDKPNLKLVVIKKECMPGKRSICNIYEEQVRKLQQQKGSFPVTLMFMPMEYIASAMSFACSLFSASTTSIDNSLFGCLYSNQDQVVTDKILEELMKPNPQFRLVFCTSVLGMGFDPPGVETVIHCKPPRLLINYLQEIGRAGRRGQQATAILYFSPADIGKNIEGMSDDVRTYCNSKSCLRECLLKAFQHSRSEESPVGCLCCSVCEAICSCDDCELVQVVDNIDIQ